MKYKIILLFVLTVNIFATDINTTDAVCQDFLDSDMRKLMLVPLKLGEKKNIDINNDGIEEKVRLELSGHDIPSTVLDIYDQNNKDIYYKIEHYENVRFDRRMQILFYQGYYYIVHYYDAYEKFPTYITYIDSKNSEHPLCKYKSKETLKLDYYDKAYTPALCDGLLKHVKEKRFIPFDIPSKFKFYPTKEHNYNPSAIFIRGIGYLDYNNDGGKEYLQFFENRYNGTENFYRVLADDKKTFDVNQTEHMISANWFEDNHKTYSVYRDIDGKTSIEIREKNRVKDVCIYMKEAKDIILEKRIINKK